MKRKVCFAALAMAVILPVAAQDTYESARLLGSDLNGTARYVGMGGAMDALGADLSTISTNPAGIGLFRHSHASISLGFVSQQDVEKFDNKSKTTISFDQAGFVYSSRLFSEWLDLCESCRRCVLLRSEQAGREYRLLCRK